MPFNGHIKYIRVFLGLFMFHDGDNSNAQDHSKQEPTQIVPSKLNDTGITWRGIYPKGIENSCLQNTTHNSLNSGAIPNNINQQDCNTGRDVFLNNNTDGFAGFSYSKIDTNGEKLPSNASAWQCVTDNVSGLMWEVKNTTASLHNSTDKFTWYNANKKTNGGKIGDWNNRGDHCYGYEEGKPKTYCHTEQFVSRVNKQGLCGFHDWRLPSRAELTSLIHFGRTEPAIDTQFFPHTQHDFYWTNSPTATRKLEAWTVSFEYGFTTPMRRTDTRYARLVRTSHQSEDKNDITH